MLPSTNTDQPISCEYQYIRFRLLTSQRYVSSHFVLSRLFQWSFFSHGWKSTYFCTVNFLAHLHLSEENEKLLVGNFIADGYKGNSYKSLPESIAKGVEVHRFIDSFADQSEASDEARAILRQDLGKLAPVAMDMIFDHFLASRFRDYHQLPLEEYTHWAFDILDQHTEHFMDETLRMYGYMKQSNWLLSYRSVDGIGRAMIGLSKRRSFAGKLSLAVESLDKNYKELGECFDHFYPRIQQAVRQHVNSL
jgi:acyl carrier protein phosphodiesterase